MDGHHPLAGEPGVLQHRPPHVLGDGDDPFGPAHGAAEGVVAGAALGVVEEVGVGEVLQVVDEADEG